jgi:hypothetical protein
MNLVGSSFRAGLLARLAFSHDGGSELSSEVFGEFVKLGIAVDFDGFLRGIADNVAVMAPSQVLFEFGLCRGVDDAVQVIGQFVEKLRALHLLPSPLIGFCDPFVLSRL